MNEILVKIFKKFKFLRFFNFCKSIYINKNRFVVPIINDTGYENLNLSEIWMLDIFKIILPIENKNFVDIGVNIGQTLLKIKSVSPKINYLGFEPNPSCINYALNLIEMNNFENTVIIPVGISNKTEIGVLNFTDDSFTNSSAYMISDFRDEAKIKRNTYIPLFDLKDLKNRIDLDFISILKIDVEGAELEVLISFKKEIEIKQPIILLEILPTYNKKNLLRIQRQEAIEDFFFNLNYSLFRVIKKKKKLIKLDLISKIEIHSDLNKCDYVVVPQKKLERFNANCLKRLIT